MLPDINVKAYEYEFLLEQLKQANMIHRVNVVMNENKHLISLMID